MHLADTRPGVTFYRQPGSSLTVSFEARLAVHRHPHALPLLCPPQCLVLDHIDDHLLELIGSLLQRHPEPTRC